MLLGLHGFGSVHTWLAPPRNVDRCPARPKSTPRNVDTVQ
ncbi:hypothetical protein HMPREF3196_00389 [Bifidobacterium bifidum]|uniref:Uncharacterized protein n=1 Tax=Bifidobacterium bifidum TaxID=1681 RepID=A0A133KS09_BIFBI|nr:hypothetical protein HMPREF3196_00389 [Bifidobacterium bifidum]